MKKVLPVLVMAMIILMGNLAMAQTFTYPVNGKQGFALTEKTRGGLHISYNLGQFSLNQLNYRGEEMSEISISAIALPATAGYPNLPAESRMMAIPQGAQATLRVVSFQKETIRNVNIAPALRIQSENEEPDMNYVKDMAVYGKNAFFPANPFEMGRSYIRGVEAVTVSITPFQYNPVTKELVVYSNVELAVEFEGGNGHFGDDRLRSPYWDPILAAELMNYDQLPVIDYAARMQRWLRDGDKGAEYLIITPNNDAWAEYANQLKDYRTRQGILTQVYRLDEMPANSTEQMKAWFHDAYNNWEIAPVAVCLMGDHGTNMGQYIPAETVPHPSNGSCITDNRYADAVGNDNLPDMVFSRLIAQTASELPVFVNKQIEYEYTNPNMDPSFYTSPVTALGWQTERWFQICSEVFGGYMRQRGYTPNRINCIYQGSPGNSWSSNQNTHMVVDYFGPTGTGYIPASPNELGNWNNGTPDLVVQAVNQGTFWVQHRDHGLEEGWGEPAVRNSHISQMNNVDKLPFVMSINCLTGKFNYSSDCFAEAWMRRTYNGENAGAVGVLCPTETSYSFVNDVYVWGVYDLFEGDFLPTYGPYATHTGNWMPAFGNVAGKYFLAQSSWPYNENNKDITYTMFTSHSDAFLRIYTQVPRVMEVNHPEVIIAGVGEVSITAPQGCMISLVTENPEGGWNILAVAEATGEPQILIFEPQIPPTEINLVVTGQDYLRYEAVMSVIPAEGPYIVYESKAIHDQNGNLQLDYGETINLDMTLKNVGSDAMTAFEAVLESESEYITITNSTAQYEGIDPNESQTVDNAFSFTVADNVPDNLSHRFTITVTNGDDQYVSNFVMKAYAPVFELGSMSLTEVTGNGNGRLDPGETAQLSFTIENKGHSNAANTTAELQFLSPYITVEEASVQFDSINAQETQTATYVLNISEDTPSGYSCSFLLDVASGRYTATRSYMVKVGLVIEDFESGVLGTGWTTGHNNAWSIVREDPYEGQYCIKSGGAGVSNVISSLTLNHETSSSDTISFYYKVSSESNWDKLHFYIDNQEKGVWSGNVNWTKAAYPVTPGVHSFMWSYTKDNSMNSGSDCAWVDFINLPNEHTMAGTAGYDVTACEDNGVQIVGYAINYDNLLWTTSGDGTFDDATIAMPLYTPGPQDLENGQATLTLTINGNGETITDETTVFIAEMVVIQNALVDMQYCAAEEPQPVAVTISGDYVSFQWLTTGDGAFEDDSALSTTYTPGPNDIANGVSLYAFAQTIDCGYFTYGVPFNMNPMPSFNMDIIPPCVFEYCQGQDIDFPTPVEFSGFIDGQMTIVINDESYTVLEGETFLLPTATLEPGSHVLEFQSLSNGLCETDLDYSFSFYIMEAPNLTVDETSYEVCQSESVNIVLHTSGGNPSNPEAHHYIVSGEDIDPIEITGENYTLTLTPAESTEIHLTKIVMENPDCGGDCASDLDITLTINVNEFVALPEISGDNELDVRLSPTSTYTLDNDVMVSYSIEPEEAGTLTPANDGKSVLVTWSSTYKGEAVLTATPISECNNGNGTIGITVKNTTDINEYGLKASLFPNPTNGNVTIQAEGMERLVVANELGQVVYDAEVNGNETLLDMSQFGTGVYMIRIYAENGVSVKRVTVVK